MQDMGAQDSKAAQACLQKSGHVVGLAAVHLPDRLDQCMTACTVLRKIAQLLTADHQSGPAPARASILSACTAMLTTVAQATSQHVVSHTSKPRHKLLDTLQGAAHLLVLASDSKLASPKSPEQGSEEADASKSCIFLARVCVRLRCVHLLPSLEDYRGSADIAASLGALLHSKIGAAISNEFLPLLQYDAAGLQLQSEGSLGKVVKDCMEEDLTASLDAALQGWFSLSLI
jgi:hypothetical protein